jgi:hypothetical protein
MYESDITKFIRQYLAEHPEEVESQRAGRAIWWDKRPDTRSPFPSMRHGPRAPGEQTFEPAGGNEWSFGASNVKPEDSKPE